jgi:hypothetical protein
MSSISHPLYINTYIKDIFYFKFLYIHICHTLKCIVHILVLLNLLFKVLKWIEWREELYVPAVSHKFRGSFRGRCWVHRGWFHPLKFRVEDHLWALCKGLRDYFQHVRLAFIHTGIYCFYSVFVSMDCSCISQNNWL